MDDIFDEKADAEDLIPGGILDDEEVEEEVDEDLKEDDEEVEENDEL